MTKGMEGKAGRSKTEIAKAMGVSRETYYKAKARFESGLSDEEYEAQVRAKQVAAAAKAHEGRKAAQKTSKKAARCHKASAR